MAGDIDLLFATAPTSKTTTIATWRSESSSPGYWFDSSREPTTTADVSVRVALGTSPGVYTIFSSYSTAFGVPPLTNPRYPKKNVTATGLSANTLYYYRLQWRIASGSPTNGVTAEQSFTTNPAAGTGPTAAFTYNTTTGTAPLSVTFTDQATQTPSQWEWDFGDGTGTVVLTGSGNTNHTYWSAGTYTVTETATNTYNTDSEVKASLITVLSGSPSAAFTVDTTIGTRPLAVTFTDQSSNDPTEWAWAFGDGGLATGASAVAHTYNAAGTYTATHTATNIVGSSSSSITNLVTVRPISVSATFTATPVKGPPPLSVQFLGTPSGDTTGILWDFGNGSTSTIQNPLITYYSTGSFTVKLTAYGTTVAPTAVTATSTATATNLIQIAGDTSYKQMLEELRRHLLMNTDYSTVCDDFVEFGGASVVLRHLYNRICRIQLETGLLRKTSTTITAPSAGVLTLPTDLIEIRSIYANGNRLMQVGQRMADLTNQTWQNSPSGDYVGWYLEPGDPLTLYLVPAITPSTFEVYYVYAPSIPSVPGTCDSTWPTFPLPFVYWWVVKYGALADLLSIEGEMYDIERANLCEQMFQEGLELIKLTLEGQ